MQRTNGRIKVFDEKRSRLINLNTLRTGSSNRYPFINIGERKTLLELHETRVKYDVVVVVVVDLLFASCL